MFDYSLDDRILLHLGEYTGQEDTAAVRSITVPGIIEGVGLREENMSSRMLLLTSISELKQEGLINEKICDVEGESRGRNAYILTEKGEKREEEVRSSVLNEKVKVNGKSGDEEIMSVEELCEQFEPASLARIISQIDEDGVINLEEDKMDSFVDREDELDTFKEVLESVKKGNMETILVSGESGVGKSELVKEASSLAEEKGFEFRSGRCKSDTVEPYSPFKEAFRSGVNEQRKYENKDEKGDGETGNEDEAIGSGSDELVLQASGFEAEDKESFEAQRKALFHAFADHVRSLASENPLLVFIDDLQWMDITTTRLFSYIIEKVDSNVLFVGAYRKNGSDESSIETVLDEIWHNTQFERIELEPLRYEDTANLIKWLVGGRDVPSEFVDEVQQKTGGNPLFIKESVNKMIEEGIIDPDYGIYPDDSDRFIVSDSVRSVIESRIEGLDEKLRQLLVLGAVMGEKFGYSALVEISDAEDPEILDMVGVLVGGNIWELDESGENISFVSGITRETVYESLGEKERKEIHEKVADCLSSLENEAKNHTEIAHHYHRAGNLKDAFDHYISSAERDEDLYAHKSAIEKYEKALEIAEEKGLEKEKVEVIERIGDAYFTMGEYDDADKHFRYVRDMSSDQSTVQRMYARSAKSFIDRGEYEEALNLVEDGLSIESQEADGKRILLSKKGWALLKKGELDTANQVFEEEIKIAENLNDEEHLGKALHDLGTVKIRKGEMEKAIDALSKAVETISSVEGEKNSLSSALNNLGLAYLKTGELDKAVEKIQRSHEMSDKIGDVRGSNSSLTNLGVVYKEKGELDKALEKYRESLEIGRMIEASQSISILLGNIGLIQMEMGEIDEALEKYRESLEISEEIGDKKGVQTNSINIAGIHYYRKEFEKALKHAQKAVDISEEMGEKSGKVNALSQIGRIYREIGDLEKSVEKHKEGIEVANESDNTVRKIENRGGLAKDYLSLGKTEKALDTIERASEEAEDVDNPILNASLRLSEGLVNIEEGDCVEAREKIKDSLKVFRDSGNKIKEINCLIALGRLNKKMENEESIESIDPLKEAKKMAEKRDIKLYSSKIEDVMDEN